MRERLKDILRQYELRERHFECVIRSKELEVLLSRARAAEQKQLAEGEKARADKVEAEVSSQFLRPLSVSHPTSSQAQHYRQELETVQKGQSTLIDKLIACCKEVCPPLHGVTLHFTDTSCSRTPSGHSGCLRLCEKSSRGAGQCLPQARTDLWAGDTGCFACNISFCQCYAAASCFLTEVSRTGHKA